MDDITESIQQIDMQLTYFSRAFTASVDVLEKICEHQEKTGKLGTEYEIAKKALRSVKALTNEAHVQDEE